MLLPQGVCTCYHCFNGMIFSWKVYIPYPCSNISWSVMPSLTTLFKIATPFPSTYSSSPYWLFLCSSYCHLIYYVFIFSLLSFRPDLRAKILSVLFPYILSVLEHYLLHSKCSINICWANEWKLRELSNLFRDKKTQNIHCWYWNNNLLHEKNGWIKHSVFLRLSAATTTLASGEMFHC